MIAIKKYKKGRGNMKIEILQLSSSREAMIQEKKEMGLCRKRNKARKAVMLTTFIPYI